MIHKPRRAEQKAQKLADVRGQLMQLRHVPRALNLVWAAAPGWALTFLLLLILQGLLPVATVYLTRAVVNGLAEVVGGGALARLEPVAIPVGLMALVLLVQEGLGSVAGYVRVALAEQTQDSMNRRIHQQATSLDLRFYESPIYYDQLQRASIDAIDRPLGLLESLGGLLQSTITLFAMAGVLMTFAGWMPLVLLMGALPALWIALRTTWQFHQWRTRNTINQRLLTYYHHTLVSDQAAAELRLFDLGGYFSAAYQTLRQRLRGERLALSRGQMWAQLGAGMLGLLAMVAALGWMIGQALQGRFSLGDLAMFWQAMNQGQRLMRNLLTGLGDLYRNLLFLEDLFIFLDLQPQLTDPAQPVVLAPGLQQGIRLENITFCYPDSERAALRDFHLEIPAGQIVAMVGENGAGKSTLTKLLCRFYDPDQGRVIWDGVDVRAVAQRELRRRITVLFQQPVAYHATAAENIALGDQVQQPDRARIEKAAQSSGAAAIIARLPDDYQTVLGKWFGHTDLSLGEWQRLALARAFVRQADLVILDEPTSAMDSWAEADWLGRFRTLVQGRTALIITHRFTTAMQADVIHVMVGGQVVESGTHAELAARGGRYAESWRQQVRETRGNE